MKKFLSILMVIACLFSLILPASAAADDIPDVEIGDGANIDEVIGFSKEVVRPASKLKAIISNPEIVVTEDGNKVFDPVAQKDEQIVRVYLCATANSLTGHIWLYFINLTEYELPLGYVTLQPYEEMSVGSLRNTRKDGGGTYYNGEAYMADDLIKLNKKTTSLSMTLNYEQLLTIGEEIKDHNSYFMLGNNCGDFACKCWNSVAPKNKRITNILVPAPTIVLMKTKGGKTGQIMMKRPDITRCFKQVDNGVREANAKSFKSSCVNW